MYFWSSVIRRVKPRRTRILDSNKNWSQRCLEILQFRAVSANKKMSMLNRQSDITHTFFHIKLSTAITWSKFPRIIFPRVKKQKIWQIPLRTLTFRARVSREKSIDTKNIRCHSAQKLRPSRFITDNIDHISHRNSRSKLVDTFRRNSFCEIFLSFLLFCIDKWNFSFSINFVTNTFVIWIFFFTFLRKSLRNFIARKRQYILIHQILMWEIIFFQYFKKIQHHE